MRIPISRSLTLLSVLTALGWLGGARAATPLQITNLTPAAGGLGFGWQGQGTNTAFTVQYRDWLGAGVWLAAPAGQPWPILATNWQDPSLGDQPARFYRVLAVPAAERGKLVPPTLARTMTTTELGMLMQGLGLTNVPQYKVRLYKMVYETISPWGARTKASGVLLLPEGVGKPLRLVSYQHGTIIQTNQAPSSMNIYGELAVGIAYAATGYAAAVPDYLGLGDSPGLHPYQHARSEATACVDLLRAVKTFCSTNGFPLTNRLFLCGYSEGGHATMAFFRELETYHTNEFSVTACAPMAGAYDMSGVTATDFLSGRSQPNPYYFAYLLAAYQDVYHLAPTLADLLAPPYNTTLPPLLNGNTSSALVNKAMPKDPVLILKPELLAAFRNDPNHPLRVVLRDNDVYAWTPRAPMWMYHCQGDQDVVYANSLVALASFQGLGATQVQLIDPIPSADHTGCAQPSLVLAKTWFDSFP